MAELKKVKYDWFKVILCAVALCILMVLLFRIYSTDVADIVKELSVEKDKYPHLIWFFNNFFAAIPVFVIAGVLTIFYAEKDKYVPVATQKEKLLIILIVAIFTFVGIMGYVLMNSGENIDPESGEKIKTLWDNTAAWFFAQILPFMIVLSYHAIRAESEEKEIRAQEEAEE